MKDDALLEERSLKWLNTNQACKYLSCGKTFLYSHMDFNGGKIKTANVKKEGQKRGSRYISFDSLKTFIDGFAES
jgi:hypothetical protein